LVYTNSNEIRERDILQHSHLSSTESQRESMSSKNFKNAWRNLE